MTRSDQHTVHQAAAAALARLACALENEEAGSERWELLMEVLEAVETVEVLTDGARDAFAPALPLRQCATALQAA